MGDLRLPDLNKVLIAGRLTESPELKYTREGTAYCKIRLANTRYYKKRDGSKGEETCFVDATLWDKQAEWVGEKIGKGRPVLVEGSLKTDTWEDKASGQKRSKIEIKAQRVTPLDWDDKEPGQTPQPSARPAPRVVEETIPEDDIPF